MWNINGEIKEKEGLILDLNRAIKYGDSVFESVRTFKGQIPFAEYHFNRLKNSLSILQIETPDYFTLQFFKEEILKTVHPQDLSSRVRFTVIRKGDGNYLPQKNELFYWVESQPHEADIFLLNQKGLMVEVFQDIKKPVNILSSLKTGNCLISVIASIHASKNGYDEALLMNDRGNITESSTSNIFLASGGVLYYPPLSEGCLDGVMRKVILQICSSNGIKVYETPIKSGDLLRADEVILTNAVQGVQWCLGFRTKRYFNNVAKKLIDLLNQKACAV